MAAKLINQALVGVHAQAAVEAIRMANKLDLKDTALLKDLLAASWGQSKILDLVLNDYNTVQSTSSSLAETMEKIRSTASPAPLRNLYKDFHCIEVEVSGPLFITVNTSNSL
jgi:3-hydroxyisobutyrate dehydrogenase-like beta-hydroxyacid dehydrogenase